LGRLPSISYRRLVTRRVFSVLSGIYVVFFKGHRYNQLMLIYRGILVSVSRRTMSKRIFNVLLGIKINIYVTRNKILKVCLGIRDTTYKRVSKIIKLSLGFRAKLISIEKATYVFVINLGIRSSIIYGRLLKRIFKIYMGFISKPVYLIRKGGYRILKFIRRTYKLLFVEKEKD
jgi:hypothetical protein